jgi:hypothetical protein
MLMGWRLKIATLGVVSASTMQCRKRALPSPLPAAI